MGTDVRRDPDTGCPHYSFKKVDRRVSVYYFYAMDEQWGPTFLKMAAYFPYPGKLWCLRGFLHKHHYAAAPIMWPCLAPWLVEDVNEPTGYA